MTRLNRDQQPTQADGNPSTWPRRHRHHNDDVNHDDVTTTTTTRRRHVDYDDVPDRPSTSSGGDRTKAGERPAGVGPTSRQRRRLVRGLDSDSDVVADDEDTRYVETDSEEQRDELRALRSGPAGGMLLAGRSHYHPPATHSDTVAQPSRRLTLPSIVKYPQLNSTGSSSSSARHTGTISDNSFQLIPERNEL